MAAGPIAQLRNEPPTFFKIKYVKQSLNFNPIFTVISVNSQLYFIRLNGMRISCFIYIHIWIQCAWNYSNGAKSRNEHLGMSLVAWSCWGERGFRYSVKRASGASLQRVSIHITSAEVWSLLVVRLSTDVINFHPLFNYANSKKRNTILYLYEILEMDLTYIIRYEVKC